MNTQMKILAASCAMIAGNVLAFDITTTLPDASIYITGSSALANDVSNAIANGPCSGSTTDLYRDSTGGSNFLYFTCVGNSTLGTTLAGKNIAFAYRVQGGSAYGTGPVGTAAVGHYAPDIVTGGTVAACPAGATGFATGSTAASTGLVCTGWAGSASTVTTDIPDAGVSDEEPVVFQSFTINQPATCTSQGDTSCASLAFATGTNFTSTPVLVQAMGLVASQPLIDALVATGAGATNANGFPTGMLAHQWIGELFASTGSVLKGGANWSKFAALVSGATGVAAPTTFTGPIVLCRRAAGSGTQAALAAHFMNQGCSSPNSNQQAIVTATGLQVGVTKTGTTVPTAAQVTAGGNGLYIIDNTSSGAVRTCMATASSNNALAVGVLSFDQKSAPGLAGVLGQYDFVGIDGSVISDASVTNGAYWNSVESTLQTSNALTGTDKGLAVGQIVTQLKTVTTQSANGVYSLAGAAGAASSKVMKFTTAGNTCRPAIN
jgi:hypothetical protein